MIWEPINCGLFLNKVYLKLHENVLEMLIPKQYLHPLPNIGLKFLINIWVFKMKDAVFSGCEWRTVQR